MQSFKSIGQFKLTKRANHYMWTEVQTYPNYRTASPVGGGILIIFSCHYRKFFLLFFILVNRLFRNVPYVALSKVFKYSKYCFLTKIQIWPLNKNYWPKSVENTCLKWKVLSVPDGRTDPSYRKASPLKKVIN